MTQNVQPLQIFVLTGSICNLAQGILMLVDIVHPCVGWKIGQQDVQIRQTGINDDEMEG